jgi:hypothetical protein
MLHAKAQRKESAEAQSAWLPTHTLELWSDQLLSLRASSLLVLCVFARNSIFHHQSIEIDVQLNF